MNEPSRVPEQTGLPVPALRPCVDLWVDVDRPIEVGPVGTVTRRVVPIRGGHAVGITDGWRARVLPGGADYQSIVHAGCAILHARYVLETDAGDRIYVENNAIRTGQPELVAQLMRGEPVDPAAIYFRCVPRLEAAAPALRWMNERIFVGTGARHPAQVVLRFCEVL
ncbi:MAG TPA: DUF3237 domain-containing protein [Burkholderiaceae bacterium]|nr:DUF3237 domain-containing protein [Burkholderiaceae bacterium]